MTQFVKSLEGFATSCAASAWTLIPLPRKPQVFLRLYNPSDTLCYVRYVATGGDAPDDATDTDGAPLPATVGAILWEGIVPDMDVYVRNTHGSVAKSIWTEV